MSANVFSPTADGVLAALLSPFFMSLGFFLWDSRWTSSGASAFALNMYKCNVASIGFIVMCLVRGFAISGASAAFTSASVGFLVLSSTLGIVVGDVLWLEALRLLGAKHVIVIDSLKPFAAAILGRVALDEVLRAPAWGGMVLTVIGVGVVAWEEQRNLPDENVDDEKDIVHTEATERNEFNNEDTLHPDDSKDDFGDENIDRTDEDSQTDLKRNLSGGGINDRSNFERKKYKRGYLCAIINLLADSLGSLLTKKYGVGMTTWSINLIRFGFAGVVLVCISIGMRFRRHCSPSKESTEPKGELECGHNRAMHTDNPIADMNDPASPQWFELPTLTRMGWLQITAGVAFVTFLCPSLSNYALFQIALGLAVSLNGIGPIYGLFMEWPFKGRRPTLCGCMGVSLASAGVVILCVWGTKSDEA